MVYTWNSIRAALGNATSNTDLEAIITQIQADMASNTDFGPSQISQVNDQLNQYDNTKTFDRNIFFVSNGAALFTQFGSLTPVPSNSTPTYKVLTGKITQSGTGAPTVVELVNTIGAMTYSRASQGLYKIEFTDGSAFPTTTWVMINGVPADLAVIATIEQVLGNVEIATVMLEANTTTGVITGAIDDYDVLDGTSFEIRVY